MFIALLMPIGAWAELKVGNFFEADGMQFCVTSISPNEVSVSYLLDKNMEGEVDIPSSVTDHYGISYSVTCISYDVFKNCSKITSVTIPTTLKVCRTDAFAGCTSLNAVHIKDLAAWCGIVFWKENTNSFYNSNPLSIAQHLYLNGEEVTDLVIPEGVTKIGNGAFYGWTNLKNVTIPFGVTDFGSDVFGECNLETVKCGSLGGFGFFNALVKNMELLEGVTNICPRAFRNCTIENLYIPTTLTSIEETNANTAVAFAKKINAVHIKDIAAWCKIVFEANPLMKAKHLFIDGKEVNDLVIPEGVTDISDKAFYRCESLTSVTMPKSLRSIGKNAFYECSNLASVIIPNGLTSIGKLAFTNCSNLASVTIPNSVNTISDYAFQGCISLSKVTLPASLSNMGIQVFDGCTGLKEVVISEGASTIGGSAFRKCENLSTVTIPSSLTRIGSTAFEGCTGLTAVHIKDIPAWCKIEFGKNQSNPLYYAKDLYINDKKTTDIVIPEGVATINENVFRGFKSLTSISIPISLTTIGSGAFTGCENLKSVYIKDLAAWCKIKFSGYPLQYSEHLFVNGEEIKDLIIPKEITKVPDDAFYGLKSLTSVLVGNSVTEIGSSAFSCCSNLEYLTIGSSVSWIGSGAFYNCKGLKSVISYIEEPFYVFDHTFDIEIDDNLCRPNATLYVPVGTKAKYEATDGWNMFTNIVEMQYVDIEPMEVEVKVKTDNLEGQNLTDNVVGNVYYNVGENGYDASDGSIVISETTNMGQITNTLPGSDDVKNNFNGMIMKVAAGKGTITVNVKTSGNAQLVVQVGNGTPMIASKTEKGDVVFSYDVTDDTYVYIYAIIGSSNARMTRASSDDVVKIYGITVSPGATDIMEVKHEATAKSRYYTLDGRQIVGKPTAKGIYVIEGRKVMVK